MEKSYAIVETSFQVTEDKWCTEQNIVEILPDDKWSEVLEKLKEFNYHGNITITTNK